MTILEKTIKGLEHCCTGDKSCASCVFDSECKGTTNAAMAHAIQLLKDMDLENRAFKSRLDGWEKYYLEGQQKVAKLLEVDQ